MLCHAGIEMAKRPRCHRTTRALVQSLKLGSSADVQRAVVGVRAVAGLRQRVPGHGWRTINRSLPSASQSSQPSDKSQPSRVRLAYADERLNAQGLVEWMQQSVLPRGYPASVTANYLAYVRWTAVGLLAGRVQSVLATQAALFAIGLGAGAIPMAAAVQWVLKDGFGHAAAIVYATAVNTRFDADAKRYRMHSTVGLTLADMVSIAMPLCPQYFFLLASISSAMSSMANIAQLSSRARIQASFALAGNLADCARAGQTQAKLMSLIGTSVGAGLSWVIGPNPLHVAACMLPLSALSLYSVYASSCLVVLNSFNVQRTERIFKHILHQLDQHDWHMPQASPDLVPTAPSIASEETFCSLRDTSLFKSPLLLQPLLGARPLDIYGALLGIETSADRIDLAAALQLLPDAQRSSVGECVEASMWTAQWHADSAYAIAVRQAAVQGSGLEQKMPAVAVWYRSGSTARTKLQAVWHASVLRHSFEDATGMMEFDSLHNRALSAWPTVLAALEAKGWAVDRVFLDGAGGDLDPCDS